MNWVVWAPFRLLWRLRGPIQPYIFSKSELEFDPGSANLGEGAGEGEKSGRLEPGEESEVVRDDRGPDVGPEVVEPAPDAARQTKGALQT